MNESWLFAFDSGINIGDVVWKKLFSVSCPDKIGSGNILLVDSSIEIYFENQPESVWLLVKGISSNSNPLVGINWFVDDDDDSIFDKYSSIHFYIS